ncbi:MAG: MFS transporter [Oscillospiraceae bacterium]|nr:MFS transporter [Oscillospiraceae bacterium]
MIKNRWFILFVGVLLMLAAGIVYAWSVMASPILKEFDSWTGAQISLAFTIMMIAFCVGNIVSGFLQKKSTPRVFILIAGALFLVGFFLASRISTLNGLYLSFSVLCGIGSGLAYNTTMAVIGRWFPDRMGLINGIILMGFGFSAFIVGILYQAYTPPAIGGWRNSFVFMGIVIFVVFVICSFLLVRPGSDYKPPSSAKSKIKRVNPVAIEASPGVLLTRPQFWLLYGWCVLINAASLALVSQARFIGNQFETTIITAATITTVVGLISIFNSVGRVILGQLYDAAGRGVTMLVTTCLLILSGCVLLFALSSNNFVFLTAGFIIGGMAYGGVTPTIAAFMGSYFGMTHYAANMSIIATVLIPSSFGSAVAGSLHDASKSYQSTVYMMIVLGVVAVVTSMLISLADKNASIKKYNGAIKLE